MLQAKTHRTKTKRKETGKALEEKKEKERNTEKQKKF